LILLPVILSALATENGDNWTVVIFKCGVNELRPVLDRLFGKADSLPEVEIPHFTLRWFDIGTIVTVSFRLLRCPEISDFIASRISYSLRQAGLSLAIDPSVDEELGEFHAWICHGGKNPFWNRNRCELLSQLSRLAVSAAKSDVFEACDRSLLAHLAVNMLFLQEATVPGTNAAYHLDVLTGQFCGPYQTIPLTPSEKPKARNLQA
jgi:hypothetical protein